MRRFRATVITCAALALAGHAFAAAEAPLHARLTPHELRTIVGGLSAATIGIGFPENFVTADFATSDSKWNLNGNRCQFACNSGSEPNRGPMNVGFNVAALIAIPTGSNVDGPFLEVYNNGQGRARTLASPVNVDAGVFTIYSASLRTRCEGGTNQNAQCNLDTDCPGGRCAACDQTGTCNNGVLSLAPCSTRCVGGSRNGKICECTSGCQLDCPGSGATCDAAIENGAQTCYLLGGCGSDTLANNCVQDCTQSGSIVAGNSTAPYANGPIHSAFFRVTFFAPDNNDPDTFPQEVEVNREENLYRVANFIPFAGLCSGGAE